MGVLSILVPADAGLPKRMSSLALGEIDSMGIDVKGLQNIELGTLWAIITDTEYDPDYLSDESYLVWTGPGGETWLFAIPDEFYRKINALAVTSIPAILEKWFATEEFKNQYAGYTREIVSEYLDLIRSVSRTCAEKSCSLFLYVSL